VNRSLKVHGPAAAMAAFIFTVSSFHSLEPPELLGFSPGDKLLHSLVYAVFGFLLLRSARALMDGAVRQAAAASVTGIFYGLTDEIHQRFVAGRHADPVDWAADSVGIVFGVLLAVWLRRRRIAGERTFFS
jgi:VanZ family protein